ncbi:DUF397 domain-containing protein [Saccharopolyspora sp. 7B]|uniref:DUF397 domain-containing protein n=1 Tax=Saccharopolyspora sp. 7B TaxID=2877240 RepID=UPI001CD60C8E|nr:DUF397 domain-containing protein [Saccharopolyspora sp. 7B]MCA1278365.1 DUF397 domain-containing protein [Saccharopolyspora sp. 7B]
MTSTELRHLSWRVSSYSGGSGNCVEIAALPSGARAVRDTKDRDGGVLILDASAWTTFLARIQQGNSLE